MIKHYRAMMGWILRILFPQYRHDPSIDHLNSMAMVEWTKIPKRPYTVFVKVETAIDFESPEMNDFIIWCRDNLRGRIHIPRALGGISMLNSNNLHRPKDDFTTPYRSRGYQVGRPGATSLRDTDTRILVLCEDANDVMKLKLAGWTK